VHLQSAEKHSRALFAATLGKSHFSWAVSTILGVMVFFYPTAKTTSRMPPGAGDPLVKPKSTSAQNHRRTLPPQDWGFLSCCYPTVKTYMPPAAGDPLVKPKGTRAYHWKHTSRQIFWIFWIFLFLYFFEIGSRAEGFFFHYQTSSDFALTVN